MSTITLSKPIPAHGNTISQIELREPTGKDIRICGLPLVSNGGVTRADSAVIAAYISMLGAVPPSSVDLMSATDFMTCAGEVLGFFADSSQPPSGIGISTSVSGSEA